MVFTKVGEDTDKRRPKRCCVKVHAFGGEKEYVVCPYFFKDGTRCGFHEMCEDCEHRFECATERKGDKC
jgi:hypothetical protein